MSDTHCDKCGTRLTRFSVPSFISEEARLQLVKEYEESGQADLDRRQALIYEKLADGAFKNLLASLKNE
jgi:hypothetical protein